MSHTEKNVEIQDDILVTDISRSRKRPRSLSPHPNSISTNSQAIIIDEDSADEAEASSSLKRSKKHELFDTEAMRISYHSQIEAVNTKYDIISRDAIESLLPHAEDSENSISSSQKAKVCELPDIEDSSKQTKETGDIDLMDVTPLDAQESSEQPLLSDATTDADAALKDNYSLLPIHEAKKESSDASTAEISKVTSTAPQTEPPASSRKIYKAKRHICSVSTIGKATAISLGALATVAAGAAILAPETTNQLLVDYVAPTLREGLLNTLELASNASSPLKSAYEYVAINIANAARSVSS